MSHGFAAQIVPYYYAEQDVLGWSHVYYGEEVVLPFLLDYATAQSIAARRNTRG